MPTESFIDLLLRSPCGQIIVCNLIDTVNYGVLSRTEVQEALRWWELFSNHAGYYEPDEVALALNIVRDGAYPTDFPGAASAPSFALRGINALAPEEVEGHISCVLPAGVLEGAVSKPDRDRLAALGIEFPRHRTDPWSLGALDVLARMSASERRVRLDTRRAIGSAIVWFTRYMSLQNALRRCSAGAVSDRARDVLGLVHRKKHEVLLALTFPASILSSHPSARPTFVDAADHSRFKVRPDARSASTEDNWGWTVDLMKFASDDPVIDGCRERVCGSISASLLGADPKFSFKYLGPLDIPRNDARGQRDKEFAERLCNGRSPAELKMELAAIL